MALFTGPPEKKKNFYYTNSNRVCADWPSGFFQVLMLGCLLSVRCLVTPGIGCLICSHLMFYLALHFNVLRCRSLYLPATVSLDCSGNSALPVCNETGQRLEQLNRRDNQSLIQTAMQNIQAIPSEIVLSGILDFRLHLINL